LRRHRNRTRIAGEIKGIVGAARCSFGDFRITPIATKVIGVITVPSGNTYVFTNSDVINGDLI